MTGDWDPSLLAEESVLTMFGLIRFASKVDLIAKVYLRINRVGGDHIDAVHLWVSNPSTIPSVHGKFRTHFGTNTGIIEMWSSLARHDVKKHHVSLSCLSSATFVTFRGLPISLSTCLELIEGRG